MRLFISDFTGICNRLEALAFAYVIREHYGHEIVLDWPELDSFLVTGTCRGSICWYHRLRCMRVCDHTLFTSLAASRNISLRGLCGGPIEDHLRSTARVAQDIRLHPRIGSTIKELFTGTGGRPVVGVHMRRGDFEGAQDPIYDIAARRHPAVPDWWFQWAMRRLKARCRDVIFYLSGTGSPSSQEWLKEFDCVRLEEKSPYAYKGPSHASEANPIGDLFALACCPVILGTPASSFSHWAANILGSPSQVLIPASRTEEAAPVMVKAVRTSRSLAEWTALSRTALGTQVVSQDDELPGMDRASTDWLRVEAFR